MEPSNKVLDSIGNSAEATRVVDEFKLKVKTIEDISQEASGLLVSSILWQGSALAYFVEEGISLENKQKKSQLRSPKWTSLNKNSCSTEEFRQWWPEPVSDSYAKRFNKLFIKSKASRCVHGFDEVF